MQLNNEGGNEEENKTAISENIKDPFIFYNQLRSVFLEKFLVRTLLFGELLMINLLLLWQRTGLHWRLKYEVEILVLVKKIMKNGTYVCLGFVWFIAYQHQWLI